MQTACFLLHPTLRAGKKPDINEFALQFFRSTESFFRNTWESLNDREKLLLMLIALSHLGGRLNKQRQYDLGNIDINDFSKGERELLDLEEGGIIKSTIEQDKKVYSFASSIMEWWVIKEIENSSLEELTKKEKLFGNITRQQVQNIQNVIEQVWKNKFDVANNESSDINIVEQTEFFPHLKKLQEEHDKLFIIPIIGTYLSNLPNLLYLFKDAPYQEIGLLDDISAKRMIVNPAEGILTYQPEAIQEIIQLSAGHPYFTQVICFTLFQQARISNKWTINRDDVKNISDQAIVNSDAGLQGFWQVLTIPERIIISAVAESQNRAIEQKLRVPEEPLSLVKINDENQRESLLQAWERLIKNRYLYDDGRKVRVELIRRWLLRFHSLQNEIKSLQTQENVNIENLVQNLTSVANFLSQEGEQQQALQLYERALAINPNNFNIAGSLAEQYLKLENFEKSLELHRKLYEADFQNFKEGYLHALSGYGHHLIIQGEYILAMLRGMAQAQYQFNGINGKGGLNGRLLEIKIANDAGIPEQAKQVAVELVKDQSILGVIGHHSSESTEAALEEYNKTDIPIISPTSTSTQLHGKKNFFRSLPDDAAGGKKLAEYAFNRLKLRKVVIFSNPKSSYSNTMREEFTKAFERLGGEVVRKPQINLADTSLDMNEEVYKSIYRSQAEAAVLIPDALHTDVALKIARAKQEVVDRSQSRNRVISGLKLLGGDTLYSDETLTKGGDAVEGLITVVPWFREAPQAINFAQQAEKQWRGGVSWRTASSYDATQAFIQALSANSDRTTIIEKLKKVNLSPNNTSGDPLKFNLEGERETDPILVQVKDGKWVKIQQ